MSSTKEVKVKKDKSGKKSKSADKIDVPAPVETSEDVVLEDASAEVKPKKDKKEKKEKKEKSEKSSKKRKSTGEEEPIAESTPKKSKRTRSTEETPVEGATSPQPEAMEVDNSEAAADEPPSKKRKSTTVADGEELEVDVTLPQPPSKKDLRRLKKGKSLSKAKTVSDVKLAPKPKADGEEGADGSGAEDAAPQKPEQEKRSEHGIWVGNLPWSVSKEDLKSFLINQGPMPAEAITRIHMPSPDDKRSANQVESRFTRTQHNKGFAYVDFSTAEHTLAAVALSEELLGGRRVLIKNNKSFEGRPLVAKDAAAKKEMKAPSKRVFLGNLRFDTTEESLKEHFERCGPIETCMVATFEDSGKCKGYAWITFADLEASARAVRGFVLEEEENSDEDTDEEESEVDEDPEDYAEAATKKKEKKKVPMKRVYVNMIQRRPVRIEFAEDAQVRYKKRYGAGGTKNPVNADGEVAEKKEKLVSGVIVPSKKAQNIEYRTDYAPRLTGGIVESKGKKVAFD
ncbi:hypothetical protein V496_09151 [Pseudogymnoascus sp. VKM F-4515 (FW-2607)]|nr:hypothetical protein V496_09151 [Pseudogymnoascus sp. VKM F-4515 (FW-2607)]KFY88641.1 hypothetical protein V498_06711 [Pseudogymnoascus sp. VKM F-4517 (FW-2822)]